MTYHSRWSGIAALFVALGTLATAPASEFDPADVEFFEKQVRPVLVEHCHACHGPEQQKAGLRLDSRAALLAGGDSGPAIVPGKPEEGYLISAIRYGDIYQMPPKGKLPDEAIANLTRWVERGAAWPEEAAPTALAKQEEFDLEARSRHWAFQPVRRVEPPEVQNSNWPRGPIDQFILSQLEQAGVSPAEPLSPGAWLRRVAFDLTGLPPTLEELDAFERDPSEEARRRVVDRLLASPHYGERWARHWLDLVRYAETYGHEFDFEIRHAFRYRDYVIRALNDDLPYDQFVIEQIAGDQLDPPRRNPKTGDNESILGTAFFWFGDQTHGPVDLMKAEADRIDNQLDVLGKSILGLTLACARCHDHKFDPIRTDDYYALSAFLQSSRYRQTVVSPTPKQCNALRHLAQQIGHLLTDDKTASSESRSNPLSKLNDELLLADMAASTHGWTLAGDAFATANAGTLPAWMVENEPQEGNKRRAIVRQLSPEWLHSGRTSVRLQGTAHSPTFTIEKPYLHLWVAGRDCRVNVVIDGFTIIRTPIYGGLKQAIQKPTGHWITFDLSMWQGRPAYVELADLAAGDPGDAIRANYGLDGYFALRCIVASPHPKPPALSLGDPFECEQTIDAPDTPAGLKPLVEQFLALERSMPMPAVASTLVDGIPGPGRVLIRGNTKSPGAVVPRRYLEVFDGTGPLVSDSEVGRLALARRLVDPKGPLVPRVIVNRLWHYHFGRGLVPSCDDFGHMGEPPTHPELLDWLADELVQNGWSLKHLHRQMVLSSTYAMSSAADPRAVALDPSNRLWHSVPRRRLEAEAIRDSLLFISGRWNEAMFGPSVAPYLTPFMDGRGRPKQSGPLDGDGRRSIYLGVRRNFLNPMFLAFDYPNPFSTIGRRTVSNVPAQALVMLNDPLVSELSRNWALRVEQELADDPTGRIAMMYRMAFARQPRPKEYAAAVEFLRSHAAAQDSDPSIANAEAWIDLAHTLVNLPEFIYID